MTGRNKWQNFKDKMSVKRQQYIEDQASEKLKEINTMIIMQSVLIYRNDNENAWIAHGLEYDQLGIAPNIYDALSDLNRALQLVHEEVIKDPLVVLHSAPVEFWKQYTDGLRLSSKKHHAWAHVPLHSKQPIASKMHIHIRNDDRDTTDLLARLYHFVEMCHNQEDYDIVHNLNEFLRQEKFTLEKKQKP